MPFRVETLLLHNRFCLLGHPLGLQPYMLVSTPPETRLTMSASGVARSQSTGALRPREGPVRSAGASRGHAARPLIKTTGDWTGARDDVMAPNVRRSGCLIEKRKQKNPTGLFVFVLEHAWLRLWLGLVIGQVLFYNYYLVNFLVLKIGEPSFLFMNSK